MTRIERRKNLRYIVLTWHHRIGILLAIIVLFVSLTGILLNHTNDLSLDQQKITSQWILTLYGIETPTDMKSFQVGERWVSQLGNSLFLNTRDIANCIELLGALEIEDLILAACDRQLIILTKEGDIVEQITEYQGLPTPITAIGVYSIQQNNNDNNSNKNNNNDNNDNNKNITHKNIILKHSNTLLLADTQALTWSAIDAPTEPIAWLAPSDNSPYSNDIQQIYMGADLSWERVILDAHSGRLFGLTGTILSDIFGLFLISLGASGVWIWYTRHRRRANAIKTQ